MLHLQSRRLSERGGREERMGARLGKACSHQERNAPCCWHSCRDIQAVSTISDESGARVWREKVANPGIGNVLALEDFERLVFVMSVLKRYSDRDVAALLECSDDEVQKARIRAFGRIEA